MSQEMFYGPLIWHRLGMGAAGTHPVERSSVFHPRIGSVMSVGGKPHLGCGTASRKSDVLRNFKGKREI